MSEDLKIEQVRQEIDKIVSELTSSTSLTEDIIIKARRVKELQVIYERKLKAFSEVFAELQQKEDAE